MGKLRGAVLGFGSVGQSLTRFTNQQCNDAEIVVASDCVPAALAIAKNEFDLAITDDPKQAIDMGIDFVMITASSAAHCELVKAAAGAGKHVFCEKPIALTLEDGYSMARTVEASGVVNVVNYSLRFISAYMKIKELIEKGILGEILSIWNIRTRGAGLHCSGTRHAAVVKANESGGWTLHHLCHGLDLLYWLLGPITSVYARTQSTLPQKESEEVIFSLVNFESGASGMAADTTCRLREHHTGVIGTSGSLVLSGEGEKTTLRIHCEGREHDELIPTVDQKPPGIGLVHFFDCIRTGMPSKCTIRDAIPSLSAALAVQQSARAGLVTQVACQENHGTT